MLFRAENGYQGPAIPALDERGEVVFSVDEFVLSFGSGSGGMGEGEEYAAVLAAWSLSSSAGNQKRGNDEDARSEDSTVTVWPSTYRPQDEEEGTELDEFGLESQELEGLDADKWSVRDGYIGPDAF